VLIPPKGTQRNRLPSAWVLIQTTRMTKVGEALHETFPGMPGNVPPADGGRKPQGPLRFAAPARRHFCSAMSGKLGSGNASNASTREIEKTEECPELYGASGDHVSKNHLHGCSPCASTLFLHLGMGLAKGPPQSLDFRFR